ncbi:MAG: type 4a pilus biogenesis protein PilO [Betaproteobacteria bacterium]|nr:type 4a pilus biogenesis protein PilO [Betaproteobacteria bacterium]
MNKWLEELKQLDTKNPGNWPWPFKIGAFVLIFVLILAAGYFGVYQSQLSDLEGQQKKEADLKTTFLEKKKLAVNLEAYQQQRAEIEQSFGALLKQLPTRSEMDALLIDINQAGLGRGLQFDLFKPAPTETTTEFYAERPINLKVIGNYHDLGAFASDVSKLPRIVLLNDLNVVIAKDGILNMEAVAKTYRYLDPDEVAAQRKAAKNAAKAGAPKSAGEK